MESPGTHTFEMQDVPAIAAVARKYNIVTMIDNTYATPLNFQPLKHGVDVVVHSATKYICGHSDVLMSTVTCNEKTWKQVRDVCKMTGQYASAQSVYLGLRGLRTLKVRLDAVGVHTRKVVDWLMKRIPAIAFTRETTPARSDYLLSNFKIITRMSRSTALWIL